MGFCQNYPNRCPDPSESCSILKELPRAGGGPSGPAENGTNVLRTPKYNKPQGKVKHNFRQNFPNRITIPVQGTIRFPTPYFNAFSRADSRDL